MFDPAYPPANAEIESAPLRLQLNSLHGLITAITTITAAQVDEVTTLNPGEPATVSLSITGQTLRLSFGIPQGEPGGEGPPGNDGEVTQAALDAAIAGSASNVNHISPLGMTAAGDYDPAQTQALADKLDELVSSLHRP
ncbi:MAG TPA: hypothetical protein PK490_19505 [Prosthecobacter sp.]|nr:hypothetical protein [Prosthecobacter sp.]HRK16475.1 hypothetical protein [Prosthecobacter sp.]